ncbi:MAG: uroporphyrinogen decarboxylase [Acidimicrobiales bacterium]|jgi:uroporphyrinogen decarboxylase
MSTAATSAPRGPAPGAGRFDDAPFIRACRGQSVPHVPVWFMRQAGRALPEYRAARGPGSILDAIARPELVAELTRQPVDRYGTDAAIFFSDIVVPAAAIGFGIDIAPGTGPVVAEPFRSAGDLGRLRPLEPEVDTPHVVEAVRLLVETLEVPLIGFAGGPFTVASYLVEGGPSKNFARIKSLMLSDPGLWHDLVERLTDMALASLRSQLDAGASAVQIFDSWAGILTPRHYGELVLPATRRLIAELASSHPGVPTILFGVGTGELLPLMATAGTSVVGVDWRVPLDEARTRVGPDTAVQGNLDPSVCLGPWEVVASETREVLERAGTAPGHVFNLGHGVLPETDPSILERVVELVHAEGRAGVGAPA